MKRDKEIQRLERLAQEDYEAQMRKLQIPLTLPTHPLDLKAHLAHTPPSPAD